MADPTLFPFLSLLFYLHFHLFIPSFTSLHAKGGSSSIFPLKWNLIAVRNLVCLSVVSVLSLLQNNNKLPLSRLTLIFFTTSIYLPRIHLLFCEHVAFLLNVTTEVRVVSLNLRYGPSRASSTVLLCRTIWRTWIRFWVCLHSRDLCGWCCSLIFKRFLNLLKPTGHVMHQQFNIQQLYVLPTLYLCVSYLSENKQRLVPLTA